jgi:hypothetical protein
MKKTILSIIALFLLGNVFAQSETTNRYTFKKATITYKLGGDFDGTRTIYIDDYGAKQAEYWEGTYEKRQPGPNERVAFKFHDIYIGKLKYAINEVDYNTLITSNPYYFYAQNTSDEKAANEAILEGLQYKKTDRVEQLDNEQCRVWVQHIRFMIEIDNYAWFNDKNIEMKFQFGFVQTLQLMGALGTATMKKIDFDAEIPASVFSDFPDYFVYQYAESSDRKGNSFDDQVFSSDEEKQKFEEGLKQKAFVPSRDINEDTFMKNLQSFSKQYIGQEVYSGFDNDNGFINVQFQIIEKTDSTKEETVVVDIRNRTSLDKLYLDDYKRSFNHFTSDKLTHFTFEGRKVIYIAGSKDDDGEQEPLTVLAFNDKDKYSVQFKVYGKYTQAEMLEMLKQTKILDL